MIWTVIEFVAIFVECFMASRLLVKYFGLRSENAKPLKFVLLFSSLSVIDGMGSFIIENEIILIAGFIIISASFSCVFLNGNMFEKVVVSAIAYMLFYFINLPVLTIISTLADSAPAVVAASSTQHVIRVIGIFITKLLYFVATQIILTIRKKERYQFKMNEWIVIVSAFIITLTIGFSIYTLVIGSTLEEYIYVIIAVLLSLLDVIIFVFMGKMNRANQKEMEKQKLQTQLSHQQNEIEQLEHQYKEISVLRHDHKSQLNCLRTLIEQNDFEEAKKYLEKFIGSHSNTMMVHIHCSSSVLNAVINEKFSKAEKYGIITTCKILTKIPEYLEYDLSIMLSNLLDNAIEACTKNTVTSHIVLIISEAAGYYRIVVKNTIQDSVLKKNRKLKTNKKNKELHGWGLKSVENITQKHIGSLDIYEKNGMFVASALLTKSRISNMGTEKATLGTK
ncbi:MAG: GHKL domain-containing protein [Ruminococcus sp.]|nr:GHKL domain-containing protein [Ruminococcus sp.]